MLYTKVTFTNIIHEIQNTQLLLSLLIVVTDSENTMPRHLSPDVISALKGVRFIAQHIKDADKDNEVS